jgi:hypothetical protein
LVNRVRKLDGGKRIEQRLKSGSDPTHRLGKLSIPSQDTEPELHCAFPLEKWYPCETKSRKGGGCRPE